MPIFEYACKKCDAMFELILNNGTKPACPQCNSRKLTKLFSGFSVSHKMNPPSTLTCGDIPDPEFPELHKYHDHGQSGC